MLFRPHFDARDRVTVTLLGGYANAHIGPEVFGPSWLTADDDLGIRRQRVRVPLPFPIGHDDLVVAEADKHAFMGIEPGFWPVHLFGSGEVHHRPFAGAH